MNTVLTNCTIIDCTGKPPTENMNVIIEDNRITRLKLGIYAQSKNNEERVIDLEGGYVLPGLWNVHTHLGDLLPDPKHLLETESAIDYAIRAGRNAIDAIRAGVTGIRVLGEDHFADVAWKRAFDSGVFVGPRLFVCGRAISITGGHGYGTLGAVEVDGPYEMRKAVREQLKHGADQIKLIVTGGAMTAGEGMQDSQLLQDEIEAATVIAHLKGKRVAAHAWGTEGVKAAVRGGVDCIEHGLLDAESVAMMMDRDVFYVPTLRPTQDKDFLLGIGMPEFMIEKLRGSAQIHLEAFQKALKAGIKICCGSDSNPVGETTLIEIEQLVRAGMTRMDALVAATRTSADLCGMLEELGTIEVGKLADLIVVAADPLEDISNIRKLKMVLKGGDLVETRNPEGLANFRELLLS